MDIEIAIAAASAFGSIVSALAATIAAIGIWHFGRAMNRTNETRAALGACAARRFIEENVPFSVNFRPRECPEMRNHAKNPVSGNVYAIFAAAIFPTAQAPS